MQWSRYRVRRYALLSLNLCVSSVPRHCPGCSLFNFRPLPSHRAFSFFIVLTVTAISPFGTTTTTSTGFPEGPATAYPSLGFCLSHLPTSSFRYDKLASPFYVQGDADTSTFSLITDSYVHLPPGRLYRKISGTRHSLIRWRTTFHLTLPHFTICDATVDDALRCSFLPVEHFACSYTISTSYVGNVLRPLRFTRFSALGTTCGLPHLRHLRYRRRSRYLPPISCLLCRASYLLMLNLPLRFCQVVLRKVISFCLSGWIPF